MPRPYGLRWFTPAVEIDLAGHPTLAAAHVIFTILDPSRAEIRFESRRSGALVVTRNQGRLVMDFPSHPPERRDDLGDVAGALGMDLATATTSPPGSVDLSKLPEGATEDAVAKVFRPNPAGNIVYYRIN